MKNSGGPKSGATYRPSSASSVGSIPGEPRRHLGSGGNASEFQRYRRINAREHDAPKVGFGVGVAPPKDEEEKRRSKRKDKSSIRKSALNKLNDDAGELYIHAS